MQPNKRNVWLAFVAMLGLFALPIAAQSPELQQRLAEVKQCQSCTRHRLLHVWARQENELGSSYVAIVASSLGSALQLKRTRAFDC